MKIATILFAYNRPEYLDRVLNSINRKIDFAFIDYSGLQRDIVNQILDRVDKIILRAEHYGCNKNIVEGISEVFNKGYDAVVVLEDDILHQGNVIGNLELALLYFEANKKYCTVAAWHNQDDYKRFFCWGWGTWKDRWEKFKLEGNESWDIQFDKYHRKNKLLCWHTPEVLTKHIGKNGTHFHWYSKFGVRQYIRKFKNAFA